MALEHFRRAWRCTCDGRSHLDTAAVSPYAQIVKSMADHIESITGYRPPTCPWRALYDPLVQDVIRLANLSELGLATADVGSDPPGVLLDAASRYVAARGATQARDMEEDRKERERKTP